MKSKLIKAVIPCLVVVVLGVGGYFAYKNYFGKKTVTVASRSYSTAVQRMSLTKSIQGTGSVYSGSTKDVSPNNNGTLTGLTVKVGDTVKKGQTLFTASSSEMSKAVTDAQNGLDKAQLQLTTDENAQKVDANKIASDKLEITAAETKLENAESALNNITVTAPIDGLVTAVNSSNGDTVQAGKSVLTIQNMKTLDVNVSVDELDINKVSLNKKTTIKFDAISDKTYDGVVASIGQTGTTANNVTTYNVVISISNPDSQIKIGMNCTATVVVQDKSNALVIPAEALVETNGQKYVRLASGETENSGSSNQTASSTGNNYKLVAIKTGIETENYIEVTSGVNEGDKVIVQLPQSTTTNTRNNNSYNGFRGMNDNMGGPSNMNGGQQGNMNRQGSASNSKSGN